MGAQNAAWQRVELMLSRDVHLVESGLVPRRGREMSDVSGADADGVEDKARG